jgi:ABC-type nickel/cobalt efflux system permease component RcnA
MKMNQILTALVGAGLLGLMSAPVMARNTTAALDTAVKQDPAIVLAQEEPQEQRHEEERYQEQMREDQRSHNDQEAAMHHNAHHSTRRHPKQHVPSTSEDNQNNDHDQH